MTQRASTESLEELASANRRAVLGTLLAEVVHEIKNPLACILSGLHFVDRVSKSEAPNPADLHESKEALKDSIEGAKQIDRLIRDLLNYSRPTTQAQRPIDLRDAVRSALQITHGLLRTKGQVVTQLDAIPQVMVDDLRIIQVLVNLLLNAAQAIDSKPSPQQITIRTYARGDLFIEVEDTGVGIPQENLTRIFDAYFTTKAHDGTGLGLFISRRLIESLGGTLTAHSELGKGSCFQVRLPSTLSE